VTRIDVVNVGIFQGSDHHAARAGRKERNESFAVDGNHGRCGRRTIVGKLLIEARDIRFDLVLAHHDRIPPAALYLDQEIPDNFPRLPLSAFLPGRRRAQAVDEFLTRPRFLAISEFGLKKMPTSKLEDFFTTHFLEPIKSDPQARKVVYALTWANQGLEGFLPYDRMPALIPDFKRFHADPYTVFQDDLKQYKDLYQR